MKIIYVAGAYTAENWSKIEDNIKKAEQTAIKLLQKGWVPLTPHKNFSHYEQYEFLLGFTWENWINCCLTMLKRCDNIFFQLGWEDSEGSQIEHDKAVELELNIYYEKDGFPEPMEVI